MTALRIGSRRSNLAMTQTGHVADALRAAGHDVEIVEITTEGDVNRAPLSTLGGAGVFASALRQALRDGRVDVAVHSLKDLPTAPEPGLAIAAVPARVDPRDALVARDGLTLGELPAGSVIGTGSPRRRAMLASLGLGLDFQDIRGNVETRLAMVGEQVDAVVLAAAGLRRVDLDGVVTEFLDPLQILPAPGQGALAVEVRADDAETLGAVGALDHADTRAATTAERALLARLEAGCSAPVGALAEVVEDDKGLALSLRAAVADPAGDREVRRSATGPLEDPAGLGRTLAETLLADGAGDIVADASHDPVPAPNSSSSESDT